ncbi:single-stranded-DNA-specific exonuclease RecJ [Butyrivibrio sp. DSM 10294]|jgi:single-stranded-DNA-specific exonuclease|uniref:single-stranded-DNA-specific exonuclease RecJ n=1 Tax=Butyrivibrio sp. DSM 10294 TaxID=2972457 RepID=UPI00234E9273|nr:single-stranded-DNA-specific exonuclease RecJ [Butyrivibrio sp. DSM 10294]MDC7294201.1 single-stranded-DNA-specific exonuclease RecJ [Butyrivibrio sp. DSM 10294]
MSKWMVANKNADFEGISRKFGISPITARLIANRLITNREFEKTQCSDEKIDEYLNAGIENLHDPSGMADMDKGAEVMYEKIQAGAKIRVIGDYDVDGICSSYILVSGLKLFGGDVDCVLPDRMKDGYGLSVKLVDNAYAEGIDTIITCDNGIAAAEQIAHAKELGMTVVVTDHHEVPFEGAEGGDLAARKEILPPADAVIDPKRNEGSYPFKEICGAVVAYKFLQVLSAKFEDAEHSFGDFFTEMLIFAGIATVCDVMELRDENRIIVKESLRLIGKTKNKGLRALIHVNSLDENKISVYHYGFVIGPCLNATGRLELASRALALFTEEDESEAAKIAEDLKNLNDSRKDLTKEGVDEATEMVEEAIRKEGMPKVIVAYLPDIHESIAGIVAGKIKEKYYRPTIILTEAADGGAKGSGRSIEKFDMFEELSACKELFTKFGGHKMAAGLSLPKENIDELRKRLNQNCTLEGADFEPVIHIDIAMPLRYASMDLVREFSRLEPFGNGNTKPLFAQKNVALLSGRILGKNKNCGKYTVTDDSGYRYEMMYFGDMEKWHGFLRDRYGSDAVDALYDGMGNGEMKISIAYYPDINSYMGRDSLQIVMNDYC